MFLKNIRLGLNLTQSEFAKKFNMAAARYSMIETGKRPFPDEKVEELAKISGLNTETILLELHKQKTKKAG